MSTHACPQRDSAAYESQHNSVHQSGSCTINACETSGVEREDHVIVDVETGESEMCTAVCGEHAGQPAEMMCTKDNTPLCLTCAAGPHNREDVGVAALKRRVRTVVRAELAQAAVAATDACETQLTQHVDVIAAAGAQGVAAGSVATVVRDVLDVDAHETSLLQGE